MSNAYDLVVIGGGPAGHSATQAYRDAGGDGDVLLVAGERRAPYERPPLSKELLRGELEADALPMAGDDAGFYDDRGITLRHGTAIALHPDRREVALEGERDAIAYKNCILALGAQPVRPPIPGADGGGVHLLRTVTDALALRDATPAGTRVVVLGSGFIGCEAAASLRHRGCTVTLVSEEPAPQQARLGDAVAARLAGWLEDEGVDARYATTIEAIEEESDHTMSVRLSTGDTLAADRVLLAAGVAPATDLAHEAGIALNDDNMILADATMRTSAPHVLACGDCCAAEHALAGRRLHVEHWGDALAQGEVAGWTAAGRDAAWETVPGFWSTIGDRTLKYAAWGDGFSTVKVNDHDNGGAFTAWYGDDTGTCVGVLAHDRDADYDAGRRLIEQGAPRP
ncbi:NAD(P)/FAD-dependent oxidoreductase [Baekduia sp. Peel2402]|uniref:NAD(P)/FAD-dependent oxidoreductase n=1 Tax=Baekduia sp. Peel2402 TaxID=3458296 RepID=UPI00403E622B